LSYITASSTEEVTEAALTTLANVAVLPDWHNEFCGSLHSLYALLDAPLLALKLQALKVPLVFQLSLKLSSSSKISGAFLIISGFGQSIDE